LGRDRPHPSRVALGPIHPPVQWVLVFFFLGVKSMGRGINHLPRSTTEVKERLQQYLFSPSGPLFYCIQEWWWLCDIITVWSNTGSVCLTCFYISIRNKYCVRVTCHTDLP